VRSPILSGAPFDTNSRGNRKGLRQTNHRLELYNLFLDDALAQIDAELRQQKRARLLQREQLTNIKGDLEEIRLRRCALLRID
jgi:hypothetical protein